jgi:hypothetical protein
MEDGSLALTVAVISDGVSGVNELLQGREGTTIPDLRVRYEVPEDVAGKYAVVLRGPYGPGGADVEGKLQFTVEESLASPHRAIPDLRACPGRPAPDEPPEPAAASVSVGGVAGVRSAPSPPAVLICYRRPAILNHV